MKFVLGFNQAEGGSPCRGRGCGELVLPPGRPFPSLPGGPALLSATRAHQQGHSMDCESALCPILCSRHRDRTLRDSNYNGQIWSLQGRPWDLYLAASDKRRNIVCPAPLNRSNLLRFLNILGIQVKDDSCYCLLRGCLSTACQAKRF